MCVSIRAVERVAQISDSQSVRLNTIDFLPADWQPLEGLS